MAGEETADALAARVLGFTLNVARNPQYAATHPGEAATAMTAAVLLLVTMPNLARLMPLEAAKRVHAMGSRYLFGTQAVTFPQGSNESSVVANMGPGVRDLYNQLLKDDPKQARAFLIQEMMASLKLMGEILSNVSRTRSEISMTFARNSRS